MKVYGYDVPQKVEHAALDAMKKGNFVARDVEKAMLDADFMRAHPTWQRIHRAARLANRLLLREKKAGRIVKHGQTWVAIGDGDAVPVVDIPGDESKCHENPNN